ncbi:helix-turn-helix domain-containing protein [Phocaeicola dorei]|nr:helix-turn-helix domain-containing protein [Phocaeicola dorei]
MNNYFGCNFKRLLNKFLQGGSARSELLDGKDCPVSELFSRCGFASKSVFYVAFRKVVGHDSPAIYIAESESFYDSTQLSPFITINILSF